MKNFSVPKYTVIKYLRDKKHNPRGVLVAVKLASGEISIHYSYCNNKLDTFNKTTALKIAVNRALSNKLNSCIPPRQVIKEIDQFNDRVSRYYRVNKNDLLTWWGDDEFVRMPVDKEAIEEYKQSFTRQ